MGDCMHGIMHERGANELGTLLAEPIKKDVVAVQYGERPFTYSWLLILIMLVAWMESIDYQGMEVEVVKVCKGTRYKNL